MSNFFVESFVGNTPTHYYSGVELRPATCDQTDVAEVGFVGRTLLNAFNALEYGEQQRRTEDVYKRQDRKRPYVCNGEFAGGMGCGRFRQSDKRLSLIHIS